MKYFMTIKISSYIIKKKEIRGIRFIAGDNSARLKKILSLNTFKRE